jgi:hypothetical protein
MGKHKITLLLSLVLASFLWGVAFTNMKVFAANSSGNAIEIESIDYVVENIHPRYWQGDFNPKEPRLFITFYIYIKNLENCIDSIKKVEVYDSSGNPWTINLDKNTDDSMRFIGAGTRFFDETLSNSGSVLYINNYRVVITTKENEKISESFSVCEPGQKEGSAKKFLFNEDYRGQKNNSYIEALSWGKIDSAIYRKGTFDVNFSVNDRRVFNARLEFYDKNKKYLGATRWFINSHSKEILDSLNNGNNFHTDGQINNVQVINQEIEVEKSKNIKKTKFIVLITKDGNQYANSEDPDNFNHESFSEPFELKK